MTSLPLGSSGRTWRDGSRCSGSVNTGGAGGRLWALLQTRHNVVTGGRKRHLESTVPAETAGGQEQGEWPLTDHHSAERADSANRGGRRGCTGSRRLQGDAASFQEQWENHRTDLDPRLEE